MTDTDQKRPSEKLCPNYDDGVYKHLKQAIEDYLQWMKSVGYARKTRQSYLSQLNQFLCYSKNTIISWEKLFTSNSLECFKKSSRKSAVPAINALSRYLFSQGKIPKPLAHRAQLIDLPKIYQDYLAYQQTHQQATARLISSVKRVLVAFDQYLQIHKIDLGSLKIEQVDAFMAEFLAPFAAASCRIYRGRLRGFLKYLYHERHIIKRDLAPFVVSRRKYAQAKPPNFLRPHEIRKLFAGLTLGSASDTLTYALVQLAFTMGLRPKEISRIRLDDISFSAQQLRVSDRKGKNPIELPMPEHTVKAIAAYMIKARPQSEHRRVFLTIMPPFRPMSPNVVGRHITKAMKNATVSSTAYWLRHTYAQNLLEAGCSIFEIKEMLGHDKIESTKLYLHVHIKLMRKVLFDETF
ncbi:MAG: tyrosine-type recombinase/integrase [Desulfobacterales bacterium]